jgi:hypothetical protein
MIKFIVSAAVAATLLAATSAVQAATYTCSNPAICKAVCGKTTCGKAFVIKAQSQDQAVKPNLPTRAPR